MNGRLTPLPYSLPTGYLSLLRALCVVSILCFDAAVAYGAEYAGTIRGKGGPPLANVYLGLMDAGFAPLATATTGTDGAFRLKSDADAAYLVVQPPADLDIEGKAKGFHWQPRLFQLDTPHEDIAIVLPPAFNMVIEAYDANGKLMRWRDFEALGKYGGQSFYMTRGAGMSDETVIWPAFGPLVGSDGGAREDGLPNLICNPQNGTTRYSPMFWEVPGYGKLMLDGLAPLLNNHVNPDDPLEQSGGWCIRLNYDLARGVHSRLRTMIPEGHPASAQLAELNNALRALEAMNDRVEQAKAADLLLAKSLRLQDDLAYDNALTAIPKTRMGTVALSLTLPEGADPSAYTVHLEQVRRPYSFGVYEGSPYNAAAWETARSAGFDLATVLLGWDWTKNPAARKRDIDRVFGISALDKLGYTIKAHGAVWLQGYGILPAEAMTMPHDALQDRMLAQQRGLLETFGDPIDLWEAMNEPAATNVVGMERTQVMTMLDAAAKNIQELDPSPTLVNSPHELSYGGKYFLHKLDGTPADDYPLTYTEFLNRAEDAGALDDIDIIGLQLYPGFHLNDDFGNVQGPAMTPAAIGDLLNVYARYKKPIHITEFSVPSEYADGATNGWWREPWNEEIQAEYAARVYTIAFANPWVQSIGWWDITDEKPSVRHGGLLRADGSPKPVFTRLKDLIASWTTNETVTPDANGETSIRAFGGDLRLTVRDASGVVAEEEFDLWPGWTRRVEIDLTGADADAED